MYADDTAIPLSSKSIVELENDLNSDLLKLQGWIHRNKLSLNAVKTQSLAVGYTRNIESQPDAQLYFSIDEQKIEMTNNVRYLGAQLASQLSLDKYIDSIKTKANCALLSILTNIYLLIYSTKCKVGLLSPI